MSSLWNLAYQGAAPTQLPTRLMCIIIGPALHQDVAYHIFWKWETCCTAKLFLAWRLALYCSYVVSTNHWHCSRFLAIVLPSQGKITCNVNKDNPNNVVYCEFHCTTNSMSASIFLCHFQINNAISQQHRHQRQGVLEHSRWLAFHPTLPSDPRGRKNFSPVRHGNVWPVLV